MIESSNINLGFFFFPSEILSLGVRGLFALLSFVFVFGGFFVLFWGVGFFCFVFWAFFGGVVFKNTKF